MHYILTFLVCIYLLLCFISGWTTDFSNGLFIALFATFVDVENADVVHRIFLSCAPIHADEDLSASAHREYIKDTLALYGKDCFSLQFLCGDNLSTNGELAQLLQIPLVGCANRRLNLAAKLIYETDESTVLIGKVDKLAFSLQGLENRYVLGASEVVIPIRETDCCSTYRMLKHFLKYYPKLLSLKLRSATVALIPTPSEVEEIKKIVKDLKEFASAAEYLRKDDIDINLNFARLLFDALLTRFPQTEPYLGKGAQIVLNPHFESAIEKLQKGLEVELTDTEKEHVRAFNKKHKAAEAAASVVASAGTTGQSICEEALQLIHREKRQRVNGGEYESVLHVSATSSKVEQLFLKASKYVYMQGYSRRFEAAVFLRENRQLWDAETVERAVKIGDSSSGGKDYEDDADDEDEKNFFGPDEQSSSETDI